MVESGQNHLPTGVNQTYPRCFRRLKCLGFSASGEKAAAIGLEPIGPEGSCRFKSCLADLILCSWS